MGELKPGWRRVKLGEVVRLNRETCKAPATEGIERYIGLEHLEPGDLRVRSWGDVSEGTTFTNRVRPGQVLFGKRRAYQRKVALADFDAVCSGDIYVFESADPGRLLPGLLPFLCQTDAFFDHAVGTSAGSLSPRTNWSSLAGYEFALPPLEEQRRMVRIIGAWKDTVEAYNEAHRHLYAALKATVVRECWPFAKMDWLSGDIPSDELPADWRLVRAEELSTEIVTKGATPTGHLGSVDTGIPFLKICNLTFDGRLDFDKDPTWISCDAHRELRRSVVLPGDVLMNMVGPPLGKVARVPGGFPEANINQAIVRYRPMSKSMGDWLEVFLLSPIAQNWLLRRSKKTSGQRNITLEMCRDLPVPIPIEPDPVLDRMHSVRANLVSHSRRLGLAMGSAAIALETLLCPMTANSAKGSAVIRGERA